MIKKRTLVFLFMFLTFILSVFFTLKLLSYHVESAVIEAIEDYTQRKIVLDGKFVFKPRLLPKIAVRHITLNGSIARANNPALKPFLQADSVEFTLTWRSLFTKSPVVHAITAANVEINAKNTTKGQTIWKILSNQTHKSFSEEDRAVLEAIRVIDLRQVVLNYTDSQKQLHSYQLDFLNIKHKMHQWSLDLLGQYQNKPFMMKGKGIFDDIKKQWQMLFKMKVLSNQFQIQGNVNFNFKDTWFVGDIQANGKELSEFVALLGYNLIKSGAYKLNTQCEINQQNYLFNKLALTVADTQLQGTMMLPRTHMLESVHAKLKINSKNAGQFFKIFNISDDFVKGKMRAAVDLQSSVKSRDDFVSKLTGRVALDIEDLTYTAIKSLAAQENGQEFYKAVAANKRNQNMLLQCFIGDFELKQGISSTPGFVFKTPVMIVAGQGSINLRNEALNLRLQPKSMSVRIPGLPTGVQMEGTLSHPIVKLKLKQDGFLQVIFGVATGGIGFAALAALDIATQAGSSSTRNNQCVDYIRSSVE